jgi:hypothetical protein
MKGAVFLIILMSRCCFAVTANDPLAAGEWSIPVKGLRGRLLFGEDESNGTRRGVVYLELQNVSEVGNDIQVYYDVMRSWHFELRDAAGKLPKSDGLSFRGFVLDPRWLSLPRDSILRFRLNLDGYGNPKYDGLVLGIPGTGMAIPSSNKNDLFLSASFTVNPPKELGRVVIWEGTLKLPVVKIPFTK